jgi:two-component system, cell cycle sensor histidine kinase and response regulator CckA
LRLTPGRIVATYVAVAAAWILLSDAALAALGLSAATIGVISVAKGWLFVGITAGILLILTRGLVARVEASADAAVRSARAASEARDAIADREARLRAILDGSPNPILTMDRTTTIRYANPAADAAFGVPPGGLAGRNVAELVPDQARDEHPGLAERWFAAREGVRPAHPASIEARRVDGTMFPVEILVAPVATPEGPQAIVTLVDLTERAALESRLRQTERFGVLGRFASILAHDVRNYLAAVTWSAELLETSLDPADPNRAEVDLIHRAADDGIAMTRSVLEFARPSGDARGRTDLLTHFAESRPILQRVLGPTVLLDLDIADGLPPAGIDGGALTQVVVNLATNAREAMPDGGTFRIEARQQDVDRSGPATGLLPAGRYLRITASDTGTGMDDATRRQAFEAFYTTKASGRSKRGTGLGLSSVYLIVSRAGGTIEVDSVPGAGTTFTIDLPAAD